MCLAGSVTCAVTGPLPNGHRLSDKGEGRGVCVCVVGCSNEEGGGCFWLCGGPIYGSSSRAPCVSLCHFHSHTAE